MFLHVFVDIFNSYGTQALRPFSQKVGRHRGNQYIRSYNFHIACYCANYYMGNGCQIRSIPISTMYVIIFFYYLLRFAVKIGGKKSCCNTVPDADEIIIAPTMRFFQWRVAASSPKCHYVGRAYGSSVNDLRSI